MEDVTNVKWYLVTARLQCFTASKRYKLIQGNENLVH